MMAANSIVASLQRCLRRYSDLWRIWQSQRQNFAPALVMNSDLPLPKQSAGSVLDILVEPWLMAVVQRNRRSVEKRRMRKFGDTRFSQTNKNKNIVVCLNCGSYHEKDTICGKCYSKVREETEAMRTAMGEDTYWYDHPRHEVAYVYEDDSRDNSQFQGKHIVEMKKKRPEWFPLNLKTKV